MLIVDSDVWTLLYMNRTHFSFVVQVYYKVLVVLSLGMFVNSIGAPVLISASGLMVIVTLY